MCNLKFMMKTVDITQSGGRVMKKKVNNPAYELFVKLLKYATNYTDLGPII